MPNNGFLEVWLQRVTQPRPVGLKLDSQEPLCKIVNGEPATLWDNSWIANAALSAALDVSKIVVSNVEDAAEIIEPSEVVLFTQNALDY